MSTYSFILYALQGVFGLVTGTGERLLGRGAHGLVEAIDRASELILSIDVGRERVGDDRLKVAADR